LILRIHLFPTLQLVPTPPPAPPHQVTLVAQQFQDNIALTRLFAHMFPSTACDGVMETFARLFKSTSACNAMTDYDDVGCDDRQTLAQIPFAPASGSVAGNDIKIKTRLVLTPTIQEGSASTVLISNRVVRPQTWLYLSSKV
jgi:hypothetical protein